MVYKRAASGPVSRSNCEKDTKLATRILARRANCYNSEMTFVPEFAPDAKSQRRALPFDLQELVLDDMDKIAKEPPKPPTTEIFHDVFQEIDRVRHYVFMRSLIDRSRRKLSVIGVVHIQKPATI